MNFHTIILYVYAVSNFVTATLLLVELFTR